MPFALDLPGPSRRIVVEPIRLPDPAPAPRRPPAPPPADEPAGPSRREREREHEPAEPVPA